jgi:hypothetical protein
MQVFFFFFFFKYYYIMKCFDNVINKPTEFKYHLKYTQEFLIILLYTIAIN